MVVTRKSFSVWLVGLMCGLISAIASSCGYDGQFRYPCQDPANWEAVECQPPQCEASGTCPEMIFGSVPE